MNTAYLIVAAVPALLIVGALLAPLLSRRDRAQRFQDRWRPDYDGKAQEIGSHMKTQTQLNEHRTGVEMLNDGLPAAGSRDRYFAEWTTLQTRYVDQSGGSTVEDDYLITEVMQLRA
jgi:hypothetical protein